MSISNIHMPSFTLVLTSGHRSHRRHPSAITFDTLSNAPDRLMTTIDLRYEDEDDNYDVSTTSIDQKDVDSAVTLTEAELSSTGSIEKEVRHSAKACLLLFVQKLAFKEKLAFVKKSFSSR